MSLKEKNNRRNFLKSILTVGSAIGFISPVNKKNKQESNDKIKMLTADGKLVEVDKSVIEKNKDLIKMEMEKTKEETDNETSHLNVTGEITFNIENAELPEKNRLFFLI